MLFHVTIRHDAARCPGYNPSLVPRAIESLQDLRTTADKFGVKVHDLYNALPDHVEYLVCEADDPSTLAFYLSEAMGYLSPDTETHAVVGANDLLSAARRRMDSRDDT
jgi:uncharacterized protein with GYD domain